MRKLFEGVFLLEGEVGGRPLQLVYLRGGRASLLLDTGCARDPERFICPQIRESGGDPARLTWIVNTHSDLDHIGGNHGMKRIAPGAILACGDADAEACRGIDGLMRLRYDAFRRDHGIFYEGETLNWMLSEAGPGQPIDATLRGGERIFLDEDWPVEWIAVPGHSKGHLALWDARNRALYGGDAMHGAGYRGLDGKMKLCPTYEDVDAYLGSIVRIEAMPLDVYVGCHWPVKRGGEIGAFCRESREFVELADRLLFELDGWPLSLREICARLSPQLGDWPPSTDQELAFALHGHVSRAVAQGRMERSVRSAEAGVIEYSPTGCSKR